jgi:hypothetical protein
MATQWEYLKGDPNCDYTGMLAINYSGNFIATPPIYIYIYIYIYMLLNIFVHFSSYIVIYSTKPQNGH